MKLKPVKLAPAVIAACVIAVVCALRLCAPTANSEGSIKAARRSPLDFFERLEWMTYDMRVRAALRFPSPVATNLGFVFISDKTVDDVSQGLLGRSYGLYWPRHIYGRLLRELAAQHAKVAAFDILFADLRPDHAAVPLRADRWPDATNFLSALHPGKPPVTYEDQGAKWLLMNSDDFLAWQLHESRIGVLAAERGVRPSSLFATNALSLADISADRDSDGVLRRVKAFRIYRRWHPLFEQVEQDPEYGVDLRRADIEGTNLVLHRSAELGDIRVPVDTNTNFDLADFLGDKIPAGMPKKARAFTDERVWHMGVVLAARELGLDLARAEVHLNQGEIVLHAADGTERILPVDRNGYFYINWELPYDDPRITREPMEDLLKEDLARSAGETNNLENLWENKLAVVGSQTTGNDLTDRGSTPLEQDTLLASEHWNIANSIITNEFVHRTSLAVDLLLIGVMGMIAAFVTWRLRVLVASGAVVMFIIAYTATSVALYVRFHLWIPIVLPVFGALLVTHVSLVTWRVVFEQAEKRRVRNIFAKVVSPNIVHELLQVEKLSLGGALREVTVLFADVRGFTEFTDTSHQRAAAYVAEQKLTGAEAEAFFDEQAREILNTVNTYLALVVDMVKKHDGTLDKYIGDCVMAFWGAPTANPNQALACVSAAIDAQRAVYELNQQRSAENKGRELENQARIAAGLPPKPMLPILLLGTGINTGPATAGLMGADRHQFNYTVFGREVNLASRLETLSGRGRILVGEATYHRLQQADPALAATCVVLDAPQKLKGISAAVNVYEVPWRPPGSTPLDEELFSRPTGEKPATTTFLRRDPE